MEAINAGWLSILPPIIAIVLALLTKEVISSLLIGILSGTVIYVCFAGGSFFTAVSTLFQMMADKMGENGFILLFLALLGALVVVVTMAGGSRAYGNWASTKIKTQTGAKAATSALGVLIFVDDYFNCLTVGTVMRPLTDKHKISREKVAYLIDATAAPICIIAPISSWAAAVGTLMDDGMNTFIQTIPFNFYALITIVMVAFLCFTKMDFGPMKKAEIAAQKKELAADQDSDISEDFDGVKVSRKGKVYDLVIPIIGLIVLSILGMLFVGGFFDGKGIPFDVALGENSAKGLTLGAFGALIIAFIMFIPRRILKFKEFMGGITTGVKSMVPAFIILILAWTISGICRDLIGTGEFVSSVVQQSNLPLNFLPAIVFVVAAFMSFSMGTSWGTFGILIPIVYMICNGNADGANILIPALGATLAGSVYGDHCSPISDTTILSSTGAGCDHISHVSTQMPYATLAAGVCLVGYIIAGFTTGPWISLLVSVAILLISMFALGKAYSKEKNN